MIFQYLLIKSRPTKRKVNGTVKEPESFGGIGTRIVKTLIDSHLYFTQHWVTFLMYSVYNFLASHIKMQPLD